MSEPAPATRDVARELLVPRWFRKEVRFTKPLPWGTRVGLLGAALVVLLAACSGELPILDPVGADAAGAPTITSLEQRSGKAAGGERVTVVGTGFSPETVVWLGGQRDPGGREVSADGTKLTFTTPKTRPGATLDLAVGRLEQGKVVVRVVLRGAFSTSGLSTTSVAFLGVALGLMALLGTPLFVIIAAATCLGLFLDTQLDQKLGFFTSLVTKQGSEVATAGKGATLFTDWFDAMGGDDIFIAIPLFTFAGTLMSESRSPTRIINLCRAFIGWLPGGLALVTLITCCFFTAFTGASGVTIIALGGLLFPILLREKYPERFSLGLLTTGGSLGLLFPPALPVIVYGIIARVQIERLYQAALVPGILLVVFLSITSFVIALQYDVPRHTFTLADVKKSIREALWEIPLPFVVVGGIYSALISATEAAAVTAVYVILTTVVIYRDVPLRELFGVVRRTSVLVGAIIVIMGAAIGFSRWLTLWEIPQAILAMLQTQIDDQLTFLIALNFFLLIVGCLMDIFSATLVVVPLIGPVAQEFGVDPYHLAVIFLVNLEIGYSTPPVGINLFIASLRFRRPVFALYRASLLFIAVLLVALILITYIPALSLGFFKGMPAAEVKPSIGLQLSRDGTVRQLDPGVAARAGVRLRDKIVSFGGEPVEDPRSLPRLLEAARGKTALEVQRGKQRVALEADFGQTNPTLTVEQGQDLRLACQVTLGGVTREQAKQRIRETLKALREAEDAKGVEFAELDGAVKDAEDELDKAKAPEARKAARVKLKAALEARKPLEPVNKACEEAKRLADDLRKMGTEVSWRSRLDNTKGQGVVFSTRKLQKVGEHILTSTTKDKRGHVVQVVIRVTVVPASGKQGPGKTKTSGKTRKTSKTAGDDDDDEAWPDDEDEKTKTKAKTDEDDEPWPEGDDDDDDEKTKKTSKTKKTGEDEDDDEPWPEGDDDDGKKTSGS